MNRLIFLKPEALIAYLFIQTTLQQQVIDLQAQVIALQERIDKMTPKNPSDEEVLWHVASGGLMSNDAAQSDSIATVRRFRTWNINFAKKHIKPYVNPKVYAECVNQMTRGLSERIAELETEHELKENVPPDEKPKQASAKTKKPTQMVLIQ